MTNSGHIFIFYGSIFFGILLGLTEIQQQIYARFLRSIAQQLKEYSEWSLDADLIADAVDDPTALQLRRVERTILFMDIRGFTAWTENADSKQAVDMLNRYYQESEDIIHNHHGHKPNFTADEVMTRFDSAKIALETATALRDQLMPLLSQYNLSVGIGIHTGEVIEGLMGSSNTRKYDIIGDAVNTAKRLESSAGRGEIVISKTTHQVVSKLLSDVEIRTLRVKGKVESLQVFAIKETAIK
jgi:class 3 adenylate cyclase